MLRTRSLAASFVAAVLAVAVLGGGPAQAHSQLTSTSPEDGAVLATAPPTVSFTFNEPLLPGTETISFNDDQGNTIASVPATVDGATMSAPWPDGAKTGTFQVAYRVVSGDGHPVTGAMTVTVGTGASESPATDSAPEPARGIASGLVVLIGLAVIVLAVIAGLTIWRRRSRH